MKTNISPEKREQFSSEDVIEHAKETKYQGFFKINEYHVSHRLFNGGFSKTLTREIFERGDAVVLLPYDPVNDAVVLLEQFRPGVLRSGESPWLLEFVAGMFDEGESAAEVAVREAKEEADLDIKAADLVPVLKYFSSPGGMSEYIHLYAARINSANVGGVYGLEEEGEDIRVHVFSRVQALQLLENGKISNAATIIGLQWLALNYQKLQTSWQT
ncbi:NUDIX domain-containing protein [Thalassomonas actiniarum]|uniref:ADP-ribose pyrophosphatase n=1 Tax=Thalassomonas actiniarum TaxID=485447 RepID=A0AAE9YTZ7_9GAMM|nr:NUDIX domain-containing protein [Thalassomonas actiniarum]WDE00245.1 NUDIX domain-containing protein [Thalassomonas actiniarum]